MNLRQFTLNRKLAILAVALGTIALFAQPHRGPFVKLDARELALRPARIPRSPRSIPSSTRRG